MEEETEVVPATYVGHSLVFLDKYTEYKIQILAFNPAGDGPRSSPIIVRTHQVELNIFFNILCFTLYSFKMMFCVNYCIFLFSHKGSSWSSN